MTFRIPSHWREEYEPKGGGTFYDDAPDSGTFRLNVITAKAPFAITSQSGAEILSAFSETSANTERLPNDCALVRYSQATEEEGHPLYITYWSVAQPIPPSHARIANFSYTMRAHQRKDPGFQQVLEMLDREIRALSFAPELADTSE